MKKPWLLPALALLLLLCCAPALAQEAQDITDRCAITAAPGKYKLSRLTDRDYGTCYVSDRQRSPYVQAQAKDALIHGVYVCFGDKVKPWQVQAEHNGVWETVYERDAIYAHAYVPLPSGESAVRVLPASTAQSVLTISELFLLGEGDAPAFVQQWQPAPEKADLMVLAAHPDDEILFFGGTIPYYAGEMRKRVVVVYMTCGTMERRSELLNGLWEMGVRTYPVIGDFWDKYSKKLNTCYDAWGKTATNKFLVGLLRQYKPEVVVTHDVNGEYGHGGHRVCADAMQACVKLAADSAKYTDTAREYGAWTVKKLYLHLYADGAIEMDWDRPLSAFGGKTGYEVALAGYGWHQSQHEAGQKNPKTGKFEVFTVEPRESDYSCYRFGLAYSAVGADTAGDDFFENIP